jgi:hypothetical protein
LHPRTRTHVLATDPVKYFNALVQLSKVIKIEADITHRDRSRPKSPDEILDKVEKQTGKEGRDAFVKFLGAVRKD